jgi:hypothetical protein
MRIAQRSHYLEDEALLDRLSDPLPSDVARHAS